MYVIDFPTSSFIAIFLGFILFKSFAIFLVIKPTSNEIPPFQCKQIQITDIEALNSIMFKVILTIAS
ncbi:hypothetical protein SRABI84_05346 [Peribacillus simplex]|nr:hypothetical protein SRABI84_05346 [Peribacillus simplex]